MPPLDPTVPTNLAFASAFLYSGTNLVQTGVAAGTIDVTHVSVVRGQVSTRLSAADATTGLQPVVGATVVVVGHPEFGQTTTQADGWFSMAVNGGGQITVDIQHPGYLEVQRHVTTRWLEYAITNPVVLIPPEPGTSVKLSASSTTFQLVKGQTHGTATSITPAEDADGARTAIIVIPPGTTATNLDSLNDAETTMRATEYTRGSDGPLSMPADLPPTSAYTYAVDLSIDEANGQAVTFSQPVLFYVDNFINFPVGDGTSATTVPWGTYDTGTGLWSAAPSGQVVKVLTNEAGTVTLDVTGQGEDTADSAFTPPLVTGERAEIAALYQAGQTFWRVGLPHFCPWDGNYARGLPTDAVAPKPKPPTKSSPDDEPCIDCGSIIEAENQILGEQFPIAGTPFGLRYQSDRTTGGNQGNLQLQIPVTGTTALPSDVSSITTSVEAQGTRQTFTSTSLAPNQVVTWTWDGKDAFGRTVSGTTDVAIQVCYNYQASSNYSKTSQFGDFGGSALVTGSREMSLLSVCQPETTALSLVAANSTFGLGGLSFTGQNLYDAVGQTFYGGDGSRISVDGNHFTTITTYAGGGAARTGAVGANVSPTSVSVAPYDIAMAPNGTLYIAELVDILAVDPKGLTMATLSYAGAWGLAVSPQTGELYATDGSGTAVRRIDPETGEATTITTGLVAASNVSAFGIAVGPDGNLYVAIEDFRDPENLSTGGSVLKISPDGGAPSSVLSGLAYPQHIAFGPDGDLYVTETLDYDVLRWRRGDEHPTVVAGVKGVEGGFGGANDGDGGPADQAHLCVPSGIVIADDGSLYIADVGCDTVRFVAPNGVISTLTNPVGSMDQAVTDDNGPAGAAALNGPTDVVLSPGGGASPSLYIADAGHLRVRRIAPPLPGFSLEDAFVPSVDGSVVYQFDDTGRHQATFDALRGQTLQTLAYDANGLLESVTDDAGNVTTITRSASHVVITAPFDQATTLALDSSGYVTSLTDPAAETVSFTYATTGGAENGLLDTLTDPKGNVHSFTFSEGLLAQDNNPAGGQRTLKRSNATSTGWTVTDMTAMGYVSTYVVSTSPTGNWERDSTDPTGATTKLVDALDGSMTTTALDVQGKTLATSVTQQGPDPRYAMLLPVATKTTTKLEPSGLSLTTTDKRTASVGSDFFDLKSQTDVITVNPGAKQQTLTATYTAGSSGNTLVATTTTGRTITTTLDAQDRVVGIALPGIAPTTISYNTTPCAGGNGGDGCGGRVVSVSSTDPVEGTRTWTTHYQYAPDTGWASSVVDALGQTVTWTQRDAVGRVKLTQLPDLTGTADPQNQIAATYDLNGNLTSLAVPSLASPAPTHTFPLYSPIDDLKTYSPPPLSPALTPADTSYAYNHDEQLTSIQVPEGGGSQTVSLGYDSVGRLSTVVDSLAGVTSTLKYAPGGLPESVTSATTSGQTLEKLAYGYGSDGPLLMSQTWSGSVAGSVSYTHDSFFRVASRSVNGGPALRYDFDADGLYAGASGLVSYSVTRDFNGKNGLLTGSKLGSVSDALTYDGFGELATYAATFNGSAVYSSSITSRDADGRISGATETLGSTTHTWAFQYDAHGDLSSVTEDGTTTAYDFDPNGNRLSVGGQASTYDAQDRLLTSPDATYTYTNNGDLLTKVTSAGTATYAYDLRGALRSVALPSGDTVAYVIDGQSRRVGRTWTHGGKSVTQGFLYDDQLHVAAELDGTGNVVSTFVYGTRFNVPDAMVRGGKTYRILSDWRGSVRAVVDAAAGTVVETIDYDAWGNATVSDSTCAAGAVCAMFQPFGFAGGLFDRETGLVRFGARDYDASVGRWTQKDGEGFGGGRNFYTYAWNDPINYVDAAGNFAVPQWAMDASQAVIDYAAQVSSGGALSWFLNDVAGASSTSAGGQLGTGTLIAASAYLGGNAAPVVASLESAIAGTGLVTVTSWASSGVTPDLCEGRWVIIGRPTYWNYLWTGLAGGKFYFSTLTYEPPNAPFSNSVTGQVPAAALDWPSGWEAIKGFLGQRIIGGS